MLGWTSPLTAARVPTCTTRMTAGIWISRQVSRSVPWATATSMWWRPLPLRRPRSGIRRTCTASHSRNAWPSGWWPTPSPRRSFFCNSGAEAIECALKLARRYHFAAGNPGRFRVVTFSGAFHGRTLTTIAAGGQDQHREGFGPDAVGFDQVPYGDLDAVRRAVGPETAAVLVEPIQGEKRYSCAAGRVPQGPADPVRRRRPAVDPG